MALDIFCDCCGEHIRTPIASLKTLSEIRRSNIFMDSLQQVDASLLVRRQAERRKVRQRKSRTASTR